MHRSLADIALVATSCAYADWLAEHKGMEPDWTWVEVGIGVSYCLAHAYARAAHQGGDWRCGWGHAVRSLLLGGVPVAIGELAQWRRREREREQLARKWG